MNASRPSQSSERIVDSLIDLARATKSHRIIVAGPDSAEVLIDLHLCGYARVTTTKTSRAPCGQHDIALVAWREPSGKALEATLGSLVHFLNPTGVLVVWLGCCEPALNQKLRHTLGRLGFRIESGTGCGNGVAVAARRLDSIPSALAA